MVLFSAPILLIAAPFFGPLLRDIQPVHWLWLVLQSSIVVAGGFITWLWVLSVYPSSTVASFSYLTPVFAIGLGHVLFEDPVTLSLGVAALLVGLGITLINRRV